MLADKLPKISRFSGLNNVTDPYRMGLGDLVQADNLNITDTGALHKRSGYTLAQAGAFRGAYSSLDFARLYVVVGNEIRDFAGTPLVTLTEASPVYWCEVNEGVYFNNGTDSGVIQPDNAVLPWRHSALQDTPFLGADGQALDTLLDALPLGVGLIQVWKGRIYAAQFMAKENQTVIWFSQPLGYHLFNLDTDYIIVPGQVTLLAPHDSALIIGTDAKVYAYTPDALVALADYGALPGQHWSKDDARLLFWTARGLCAALPFTNLTDQNVSVAPGVSAGGSLMQIDGQKRFVVAIQQGGEAFNER